MTPTTDAKNKTATPRLAFFERYLSLWVALCMVAGAIIGKAIPAAVQAVRGLEFGKGSQRSGFYSFAPEIPPGPRWPKVYCGMKLGISPKCFRLVRGQARCVQKLWPR